MKCTQNALQLPQDVQKHELFGKELAEGPIAETVAPTSDRMLEEIGHNRLFISIYMENSLLVETSKEQEKEWITYLAATIVCTWTGL